MVSGVNYEVFPFFIFGCQACFSLTRHINFFFFPMLGKVFKKGTQMHITMGLFKRSRGQVPPSPPLGSALEFNHRRFRRFKRVLNSLFIDNILRNNSVLYHLSLLVDDCCRVTNCSPHLDRNRRWAQQAQNNKFVREWVKELG